jgi:succinate dehydrogenase / fumarate reductase cytochrome b subunit
MDAGKWLRSSSGEKALLAGSGAILVGWLVLHMVGNLGAFSGADAVDGYAAALRRVWPLLWLARVVLVAAALLHVGLAVALVRRARRARGTEYALRRTRAANWASRGMAASGLLLLAFIVFHLLHMTFGSAHPAFIAGAVHHNLVVGLGARGIALLYIGATVLLGLHLFHGLYAAPRSLGLRAGSRSQAGRPFALAFAALLALGFALVPIAALLGVLP